MSVSLYLKGKLDEVKRDKRIQDFKYGGHRMADLNTIVESER